MSNPSMPGNGLPPRPADFMRLVRDLQRQIDELTAQVSGAFIAAHTSPPSGAAGGDLTGTYPNPSLANTPGARADLGLGSSATHAATDFDAAGAAAAAQAAAIAASDPAGAAASAQAAAIAASLQKSANLSDLSNVATARDNLYFRAELTATATINGGGGTGDQTLWTPANMPAASLAAGVTVLRVRVGGNFDNIAASGAFNVRLKANGTTIASIPIAINQTNAQTLTTWWADLDVFVDTTGATGAITVVGGAIEVTNAAAGQNPRPVITTTTLLNLTAGLQLTLIGQVATGNAGNIIRAWRGIVRQVA